MMVADVRLVTMRSEIRFEKAMKISIRGFPIHHFQAEKVTNQNHSRVNCVQLAIV